MQPSNNSSSTERSRKSIGRMNRRSLALLGGFLALSLISAGFFIARRKPPSTPRSGDVARAEPVRGGAFRFPLMSPLLRLDPARARRSEEIMVTQQIFDGLTAFDEHLNIVPALARFWEISPDGRTYTFELRPEARFHNGRPVTAEDCVFSFERLLTPELNEQNYHYFSRILGAEAFHEGRADKVAGLRALDPRTFQIRFATPFVPCLSVLSMYCSKILPKRELVERGEDFFKAPLGTGPFRFSRWIGPGEDRSVPIHKKVPQAIRLEANRDYFGGRAYLDELIYRAAWNAPGAEEEKPLDELVDSIETSEPRFADWVPVATPELTLYYIALPTHLPPYNDARVRRALNYALDKRNFIDSMRWAAGAPVATGIVPPGIPGFLPAETAYEHNLEKARRLLAEAGYPGGAGLPPLEMLASRFHPAAIPEKECLTSCLAKLGLELKEVRARRSIKREDPQVRNRPLLLWGGWVADFPDPDNFLRPLFHSASPVNHSRYQNREVDRLLDRAWTETSYTGRNDLYHQIEKIVLRDSPIIPVYYGRSRFMVRPGVKGFSLSPLGYPYIKMYRVWLAGPKALSNS